MKKYIKYVESNGEEINKEYSDEAVVKILQQQEVQGRNYEQMAVMFGLDKKNGTDILNIVFFNDRPADDETFKIHIADVDFKADKEEGSAFCIHIETLLLDKFPEKALYSQEKQLNYLIKRVLYDDDKSFPISTKRDKGNFGDSRDGSVEALISSLFSDSKTDKSSADFRREKVMDSYSPISEICNLPYDENILILELEEDIKYLEDRLKFIKVSIQPEGFSDEYDDYIYSIIIQMNQLHKDEYCEIDIRGLLEKHDGIEEIKQKTQHIGDVISKEWPKINVFVDCTINRND